MEIPTIILTKYQTRIYGLKIFTHNGHRYRISATVRHDDQCGNGHNTFSITGQIDESRDGSWREFSGGCVHEKIAEHFPELAPLIKWHLCSTEEPLHYVSNVVYLAGDRDCWGLKKGEFRQHLSRGPHQAEGTPDVPQWVLKQPEVTQVYAAEKPVPVTLEWQPGGMAGNGKERELDAARRAAVWPEATDAELCQEPEALKAALAERLPALMVEFRAAVESLNLIY